MSDTFVMQITKDIVSTFEHRFFAFYCIGKHCLCEFYWHCKIKIFAFFLLNSGKYGCIKADTLTFIGDF